MITITHKGKFQRTKKFFDRMSSFRVRKILVKYAEIGVEALASATPVDTGLTSESWGYEVVKEANSYSIYWSNTNVVDGVNIAVILQYGHGTGTGGYVRGLDYINPSIQPIFESMADSIWKEVTSS